MSIEDQRLIEVAFPLKQASLDSVHEKNVRHGHISTLHIWPARRPLAACRAALIATLLPDPGTPEKRKELLEKIGGKVVTEVQKKKVGGKTVETSRSGRRGASCTGGTRTAPTWTGSARRSRRPTAAGLPGCSTRSPGAGRSRWRRCGSGARRRPSTSTRSPGSSLNAPWSTRRSSPGRTGRCRSSRSSRPSSWRRFSKGPGKLTKKQVEKELAQYQRGLFPPPEADLAWHVRAWGWWVLQQARKDLERFYPTIDGKPTVAYLWARTVTCKNCRATIPCSRPAGSARRTTSGSF